MSGPARPEDFVGLLAPMRHVATTLAQATTQDELLDAIVDLAVRFVPGVQHAGVTGRDAGRFSTWSASSDLVQQVDTVQYRLNSGPCVDAIKDGEPLYNSNDLEHDEQWPAFGRAAYETTGVRSMMSHRMFFDDDPSATVSLNLYSTKLGAFDAASATALLGLATQAAFAIAHDSERQRATNLEIALHNSRQIGTGMGVLIWKYKITTEDAFDLLRLTSQNINRKLADIALEVVETGELPVPDHRHLEGKSAP